MLLHAPPEKLYKYRPLDAKTIQTVVSSAIYFAEPSSFNDPFDCRLRPSNIDGTDDEYRQFFTRNLVKRGLPAEKVTCEVERMIREGKHRNEQILDKCWDETQKEENKKAGLCCLTEDPDNILMWSHYADSHRGCCLQFSTLNSIFKTARIVEYPPSYPNHRFLDCINDHELLYKLTIFTKANLWAYEKEWRVIDDGKSEKGSGLWKFEQGALTGIIFGSQMAPEHKDLLARLVADRNPSIQLYQARPWKREFKMQIDPILVP